MPATIPTSEPRVLTAGDTWQWTKHVPNYSAAESWQLTYAFRGGQILDLLWTTHVTAHANGTDFSVTVPATATDDLPSGTYKWAAYVTKAGERHEVDNDVVTVRPNLAVTPVGGSQTHAEKTLAVIEAALEGRLTSDVQTYTILGRSVEKIPVTELRQLRSQYAAEVWRERHPGQLTIPVEVTFTAPS